MQVVITPFHPSFFTESNTEDELFLNFSNFDYNSRLKTCVHTFTELAGWKKKNNADSKWNHTVQRGCLYRQRI